MKPTPPTSSTSARSSAIPPGETKWPPGPCTVPVTWNSSRPIPSFSTVTTCPQVSGFDPGLASRVKVIPFRSQFRPEWAGPAEPEAFIFTARDRAELAAAFTAEMSGILGWIVRGAVDVYRRGFALPPPPPAVRRETRNYLLENDLPGQFFFERARQGPGLECPARRLYQAFYEWCEDELRKPKSKIPSETWFGRQIKARGLTVRRDSRSLVYLGLELVDAGALDSEAPVPARWFDM